MSLSKADMIVLLEKAQELIDTVIGDCPDDNDIDDMDSPLSYLVNASGDLSDAINLLSESE
jgi:hypothetical protein